MNKIIYEKKRKNLKVIFSSEYNPEIVGVFKRMKQFGLKFDPELKDWYITLSPSRKNPDTDNPKNYTELLKYYSDSERDKFLLLLNTKNRKLNINYETINSNPIGLELFNKNISLYNKDLYDFQIEDIKTLCSNKSTILANDMGLGKTRISIVYSKIMEYNKVLVVCPASLKWNWKAEVLMVDENEKAVVLPEEEYSDDNKYYIINYDMLLKEFEWEENPLTKKKELKLLPDSFLNKYEWDCLLLDEAHYIKNPNAKRSQIILTLCTVINSVIPITGTPIKAQVKDLYSLLVAIKHEIALKGFFAFAYRYCGAKKTYFGWDYTGSSNLSELNNKIMPYMIRRKKEDCINLPEKIISEIRLHMNKTTKKQHDILFSEYVKIKKEKLNEKYDDKIMTNIKINSILSNEELIKLNLLNRFLSSTKVPMICDAIETMLAEDDERKIIIFSNYHFTINSIYNKFHTIATKITGETSSQKREEEKTKFQTDTKIRIMVGNIIAMGTGLTLTKADTVMFCDLSWLASDHAQAIDRAHRIGTTKTVHVFYFIYEDSLVEMKRYQNIEAEKDTFSKVIDDEIYKNSSYKDNEFNTAYNKFIKEVF